MKIFPMQRMFQCKPCKPGLTCGAHGFDPYLHGGRLEPDVAAPFHPRPNLFSRGVSPPARVLGQRAEERHACVIASIITQACSLLPPKELGRQEELKLATRIMRACSSGTYAITAKVEYRCKMMRSDDRKEQVNMTQEYCLTKLIHAKASTGLTGLNLNFSNHPPARNNSN